jgi:hypothetical protein
MKDESFYWLEWKSRKWKVRLQLDDGQYKTFIFDPFSTGSDVYKSINTRLIRLNQKAFDWIEKAIQILPSEDTQKKAIYWLEPTRFLGTYDILNQVTLSQSFFFLSHLCSPNFSRRTGLSQNSASRMGYSRLALVVQTWRHVFEFEG